MRRYKSYRRRSVCLADGQALVTGGSNGRLRSKKSDGVKQSATDNYMTLMSGFCRIGRSSRLRLSAGWMDGKLDINKTR